MKKFFLEEFSIVWCFDAFINPNHITAKQSNFGDEIKPQGRALFLVGLLAVQVAAYWLLRLLRLLESLMAIGQQRVDQFV